MAIRLYESAWVELEGQGMPLQVFKDRKNPAVFNIGDFQYDIDGRPMKSSPDAPSIMRLHSLQSAKDAGLPTDYRRDIDPGL
jgi:hypothetical protein